MKRIGIIGLGNMGMGMAKNLLEKGFSVKGFDIREEQRKQFEQLGGISVLAIEETAINSDVIFLMVLNGDQVLSILNGPFKEKVEKSTTIIISATIGRSYVKQAEELLLSLETEVIDMPVSGGRDGAHNGTLTLMASGRKTVFENNIEILQAIGKKIYHVGEEVGLGQVVKSCLQAMMGPVYEGLFEAMVLGSKARLDPVILSTIINESFLGSNLTKSATEHIINRRFINTGSHIDTMHKDLTISMELAKELSVPMFATSVALEMFQAGKNAYPDGDNWCIIQLLEKLAGIDI
jgi:putative dehydrogenase